MRTGNPKAERHEAIFANGVTEYVGQFVGWRDAGTDALRAWLGEWARAHENFGGQRSCRTVNTCTSLYRPHSRLPLTPPSHASLSSTFGAPHTRPPGLCFNAGVMLLHLGEWPL